MIATLGREQLHYRAHGPKCTWHSTGFASLFSESDCIRLWLSGELLRALSLLSSTALHIARHEEYFPSPPRQHIAQVAEPANTCASGGPAEPNFLRSKVELRSHRLDRNRLHSVSIPISIVDSPCRTAAISGEIVVNVIAV